AKKRSNESPEPLSLPDLQLDAILSFLKDTRSAVNWSARELKDCLQMNSKQAQQILAILEMQGYVIHIGAFLQFYFLAVGAHQRIVDANLSVERIAVAHFNFGFLAFRRDY